MGEEMQRQSFMIGVGRLFLAEIISDTSSGIVYGIPFDVPGTEEIGVAMNNSDVTIYADDGPYENVQQQGDIIITMSLAGLSGRIRAEATGGRYDSNIGLVIDGNNGGVRKVYAVGYRRQKANGHYRYAWYYKGTFSKPDSSAKTKSGSVSHQAEQYEFKALSRACDGEVYQTFDSDDVNCPVGLTPELLNSALTGWFSSPNYVPVAPGTPISDLAATSGAENGEINLTFSAATGMTSGKVQIQDPAIGIWIDATLKSAITAESTSAIITGLTQGNTYNCRLVVLGGNSNGISNTASASAKTGV
jgi:phi13 family phage major tail protein